LIDRYSTREVVELRFADAAIAKQATELLSSVSERVETLPDRVLVYTADGDAAVAAVNNDGVRPESVLVRRSTLEDVFLRLTGRSLVE
jgi:lipooligosaccharide transport system ATP-binding protein